MLWIVLSIVLVVLAAFYFHKKVLVPHTYWTKKGAKQGPQVILFGNAWESITKKHTRPESVQLLYNQFPEDRYFGMYSFLIPLLVIRDPELIRQITVKDFDHFTDHMNFMPTDDDPLFGKNLLLLKGDKWRHMRATVSPTFTGSKMKAMFELMNQCAAQFANYFLKTNEDLIDVELKDIFSRYANDVIATCAFGAKCDSLEQPNNEFYVMGKEATDFTSYWRGIKFFFYVVFPRISKFFGNTFFSKAVSKFFRHLVKESVKMREDTKLVRPDMIHLLMEARKGKLSHDHHETKETGFATVEESSVGTSMKVPQQEITLDDMTAQALIFFVAGFDSVSILMCFLGHELALNPDIQERLQKEIDDAMEECNEKLTYDVVNRMKYLDMVIAETLRKWPGAVNLDRKCTIPYTIQPKSPSEVPVELTKGDYVFVPVWGIHHDPQYYPNPERFDPERFSEENKGNIKPYTYLPFGSGPRNCVGSRFALLEAKAVFVHLLFKFHIVVTEKTQVPLKLSQSSVGLGSEKGFNLSLKKRRG